MGRTFDQKLKEFMEDYIEEELENNKEEKLDFTISLSQDSVIKMLKKMALFNNFTIISIELEPLEKEEEAI